MLCAAADTVACSIRTRRDGSRPRSRGPCDRRDLKEYMSTSLQSRVYSVKQYSPSHIHTPTPALVALQITLSALGPLECTLQGIWTNRGRGQERKCCFSACEDALSDSSGAQLPSQQLALELNFPPFPSPLFPLIKYLHTSLASSASTFWRKSRLRHPYFSPHPSLKILFI